MFVKYATLPSYLQKKVWLGRWVSGLKNAKWIAYYNNINQIYDVQNCKCGMESVYKTPILL